MSTSHGYVKSLGFGKYIHEPYLIKAGAVVGKTYELFGKYIVGVIFPNSVLTSTTITFHHVLRTETGANRTVNTSKTGSAEYSIPVLQDTQVAIDPMVYEMLTDKVEVELSAAEAGDIELILIVRSA